MQELWEPPGSSQDKADEELPLAGLLAELLAAAGEDAGAAREAAPFGGVEVEVGAGTEETLLESESAVSEKLEPAAAVKPPDPVETLRLLSRVGLPEEVVATGAGVEQPWKSDPQEPQPPYIAPPVAWPTSCETQAAGVAESPGPAPGALCEPPAEPIVGEPAREDAISVGPWSATYFDAHAFEAVPWAPPPGEANASVEPVSDWNALRPEVLPSQAFEEGPAEEAAESQDVSAIIQTGEVGLSAAAVDPDLFTLPLELAIPSAYGGPSRQPGTVREPEPQAGPGAGAPPLEEPREAAPAVFATLPPVYEASGPAEESMTVQAEVGRETSSAEALPETEPNAIESGEVEAAETAAPAPVAELAELEVCAAAPEAAAAAAEAEFVSLAAETAAETKAQQAQPAAEIQIAEEPQGLQPQAEPPHGCFDLSSPEESAAQSEALLAEPAVEASTAPMGREEPAAARAGIPLPAEPSTDRAYERYVVFRSAGVSYALHMSSVREVERVGRVTPVPGAPAVVRGLINLRGEILPLLEFRLLLGAPQAESAASGRLVVAQPSKHDAPVALLVDELGGIALVDPEETNGIPQDLNPKLSKHVIGSALHRERRVLLLNPRTLLDAEALAQAT